MKKICFLSLMLIAAHNFTNAQTQFNVNAGSGIWIVNSNPKSFDGQTICDPWFAPTLFVGASASKTFESNFVASIGHSKREVAEDTFRGRHESFSGAVHDVP